MANSYLMRPGSSAVEITPYEFGKMKGVFGPCTQNAQVRLPAGGQRAQTVALVPLRSRTWDRASAATAGAAAPRPACPARSRAELLAGCCTGTRQRPICCSCSSPAAPTRSPSACHACTHTRTHTCACAQALPSSPVPPTPTPSRTPPPPPCAFTGRLLPAAVVVCCRLRRRTLHPGSGRGGRKGAVPMVASRPQLQAALGSPASCSRGNREGEGDSPAAKPEAGLVVLVHRQPRQLPAARGNASVAFERTAIPRAHQAHASQCRSRGSFPKLHALQAAPRPLPNSPASTSAMQVDGDRQRYLTDYYVPTRHRFHFTARGVVSLGDQPLCAGA